MSETQELEVVAWRIGNKFNDDEVIWTYFDGGDDVNVEKAVPLCDASTASATMKGLQERIEALMRERTSLIETKREQIAALTARAEAAEAERDALRKALGQIRELNMTGRDESGHRWANSDLIDQTIALALSGSKEK